MKQLCRLLMCVLVLCCSMLQARVIQADGIQTNALQSNRVDIISPLAVRNFDPAMMRFFDPTPDSALRAYQPSWSFEANQHYSSINLVERLPNQQLLIDMELYIFDPVVRYSLMPKLELSLRTPVLLPSSGVSDAAIQTFHGWFNMPNGGRELRPNNSYAYVLNHADGARWQSSNRWQMGNVELSARYHLLGNERWALAGLAALKLPTASRSQGWGSGAFDLALGLVSSLHRGRWFAHIEGWLIQPLANDESGIHYKSYARGSLATGYELWDNVAVIVQAQGGHSPYQSQVAALDHPPFLISFGLRGSTVWGWAWSLAVVENISQKTTQDISIMAGVNWQVE